VLDSKADLTDDGGTRHVGRRKGAGSSSARLTAVVAMLAVAVVLAVGASSASAGVIDVTLAGPGAGTVISSPAGIDCSNVPGSSQTACSHEFGPLFSTGTLTATPDEGSAFLSWSGAGAGTCSSGGANPCTTGLLFFAQSVTATFVAAPEPPTVVTGTASEVEFPSARVAGSVNPDNDNFAINDCYFEYGLTTDYGEKAACSPGSIGTGTGPVAVSASIGVLDPGKTYHYRLVASNGGGSSRGTDQTFTSGPAPADDCPNAAIRAQQGALAQRLPNCGAYELVTPPFTAGQSAGGGAGTADGNRLITSSVGGFAGTENLTDLGVVYLTERTDTGWKTSALAPPASEYPYIGSSRSALDYTRDGSRSLWFVNLKADEGTDRFTPIVRDPDGTFHVAGPTQNDPGNAPVATSGDLNTVLQATATRPALTDGTVDSRITADGVGQPVKSLYASTRGPGGQLSVRQVAYRAGATMFPACGAGLGGEGYNRNSVSSDGQKIFFSSVGDGQCRAPDVRRVWAKIGDDDPIDLSASQCPATCGPERSAYFRGASRDGSRVSIMTEQRLLPEDGDLPADLPGGGQDTSVQNDLYEYDFNATGQKLRLVTGSADPAGARVWGALSRTVSEDGSYVYFVATGRALAGENNRGVSPQPGGFNLYVYHRAAGQASGTTTFIGALASPSERGSQLSSTGRYLLFGSTGDLTGERLAGDSYIEPYLYDAQDDELLRVWTDDPAHNGPSRVAGARVPSGSTANAGMQSRGSGDWTGGLMVSDDGSMVGFETEEPLSPDDRNTATDAYLWEAATGRMTMLTDGTSRPRNRFAGSGYSGMTPSGSSIFLSSASPFVKEHTSGQSATYVIRSNGGFPEQAPSPAPCVGEGCQGAPVAPPVVPVAGSVGFAGPGNAPSTSVSVAKLKAVVGQAARLRVRVPAAGRISITGSSVRNTKRSAGRARVVTVRVALSRKAKRMLKKRKRLSVRVSVAFQSRAGGSASKTVRVVFKQPKAKKKGGR
jgi:hypothetical protein